ncbi:hypothetical protein [Fuerstiella marisgermanici]|uniref:Uncharacterized protein n=1 Tax=Fuerstiella marisgermanici TaxID=1891926 RepID=A0A1P8WFD8_9PLAN|nr:hypothetical protein [Fuerstiella marisgermanici]APZ92779.1 hypothetical protein Fuma_02391 [Fuerstiella marisgermanici]
MRPKSKSEEPADRVAKPQKTQRFSGSKACPSLFAVAYGPTNGNDVGDSGSTPLKRTPRQPAAGRSPHYPGFGRTLVDFWRFRPYTADDIGIWPGSRFVNRFRRSVYRKLSRLAVVFQLEQTG